LARDRAAVDNAVAQLADLGVPMLSVFWHTCCGESILANTVSLGTVITDQLSAYIAALSAELGVSVDDPVAVMEHIAESFGVRADLDRAGLPHEFSGVIC